MVKSSIGRALIGFLLAMCSAPLLAQNPQLRTKSNSSFPTVVFNFVLWNADPPYYSLAIDSTGAATYQSAPDSVDRDGVPYQLEFQTSDGTRRTTFNIARELGYFRGDFPVSLNSPEKNSVKTLTYHDVTYDNHIVYSESTNGDIQELTSVLEEISATLESGRRLANLHQHDKGGLDAELARVKASAERHLLREWQAIAPVLQSIASDQRLSEKTRQQAESILDLTLRAKPSFPAAASQ